MAYILYIRYILYIKYSNIYIAIATVTISAGVYIGPQGPPYLFPHRGKRAPLALRRPPPLPAPASRPQTPTGPHRGTKKGPAFAGPRLPRLARTN